MAFFILQEDGTSYILQEDGSSKLILQVGSSPSASISSSISPSSSLSPSTSLSPSISPSSSRSPSSSISASTSPSPSQGFADYTRGSYLALPTNDNDLTTYYTDLEIKKTNRESNQVPDLEDDIEQEGELQYMIHQFKNFVGANLACGLDFSGESSLAPSLSPVYLQVFNQNTQVWDTVDTDGSTPANITFNLFSEYIDLAIYKNQIDQAISVRVWQKAI